MRESRTSGSVGAPGNRGHPTGHDHGGNHVHDHDHVPDERRFRPRYALSRDGLAHCGIGLGHEMRRCLR